MTKDDVIRMAREAGIDSMPADYHYRSPYYAGTPEELERFAALVAAAELEACAKVCDKLWSAAECAEAIRKRGNT